MSRVTIVMGLGLCALTIIALLFAASGKMATALIPMIFGIPLVIAGIVSLNPHRRRPWTAFACLIALMGGLGAAVGIVETLLDLVADRPANRLPLLLLVILAVALFTYAAAMTATLYKTRR